MRTYYFDKKDGVSVRDGVGLELPSVAAAIEHSKKLAGQLRTVRPHEHNLHISVIDENGAEIHREPVHPGKAR